jgi:GT2 family glycosyltransferase
MGRTSIVVVTFNHRRFVDACLDALDGAGLDAGSVRLILVDNASTDGTAERVRERLEAGGTRTRGGLPVLFLPQAENLGFAGGNNLALRRALEEGDEFAYLLNPDTEARPGFLAAALEVARQQPDAAQVQSLLVRLPRGDVVNTWGNALHFLGFGYAAGDGVPLEDPRARAETAAPHEIPYASGAGVLLRL